MLLESCESYPFLLFLLFHQTKSPTLLVRRFFILKGNGVFKMFWNAKVKKNRIVEFNFSFQVRYAVFWATDINVYPVRNPSFLEKSVDPLKSWSTLSCKVRFNLLRI